ncbi:hypothetical protein [Herbiconiux liukaitaii]
MLPATVIQPRNGRVEVLMTVEGADPIRMTVDLADVTLAEAS